MKKTKRNFVACAAVFAGCLLLATSCSNEEKTFRVGKPTCEYAVNPLGVDALAPQFGWRIYAGRSGGQSAYRILVADSEKALSNDKGNVWDSGKVLSSRNQGVRYEGPAPEPGRYYYWKVQVWDEKGKTSVWSEPAFWLSGLSRPEAWAGKWISARYAPVSDKREFIASFAPAEGYEAQDTAAVYMRKTFLVERKLERATAVLCGLGYEELYVNGIKAQTAVLDPAFSDYQRSVYYTAHDITPLMRRGENVLGVILGNGFYSSPTQDFIQTENANWKTPPKLLLNLIMEYSDGHREVIATDETWRWSTGELVYNSIRSGETIDHRLTQRGWDRIGFDDSHWAATVSVPAPVGTLRGQIMPPMRVCETISPVAITEPMFGRYLVDFGKNITGWVSLDAKGDEGEMIVCDFNEHLNADGTLNTKHSTTHTQGRFQQEHFIFAGRGTEHFEPRFTYHGFRYAELRGLKQKPAVSDIRAKSVHTAFDTIGKFASSDMRLNQLYRAIERTLLNSAHSLIAEEPTREKMGWTLDAGVAVQSYQYFFDATNVLRKVLQDYIDAQEPSGHIASIVPTTGWAFADPETGYPIYWDDVWWGGSIFLIADALYTYTADTAVIAHAFDAMRGYVDYTSTTTKNGLVYWSLGDWIDMGFDFVNSHPGLTPVELTSTAGYAWMTRQVSRYAQMLGRDKLAADYAARADKIAARFNEAFLDRATGRYDKGSQTAQALPLWLDLVPPDVKPKAEERLLEAVAANDGHISSGFIGVVPLLEYLSDNGHMDLAYAMVTKPEAPGWLFMVDGDKSTMGESNYRDESGGSGHHPYGANAGFWLFKYLGGIRADRNDPGYRNFIVAPWFAEGMESLQVSTESLHGKIRSSWRRTYGTIVLEVDVPGNTTARLQLPAGYQLAEGETQTLLPAGHHRLEIRAVK